jgi:AraC-like DNA-binding protein
MSRSVFAASFREAMGTTPGQYLQGWRVGWRSRRCARAGR